MDIRDIHGAEDFRKLSPKEQKEYVHELIHSEAAGVHAALFNPETKQVMGVSELVEELGEEKVTEMIMQAMNDMPTETVTLSGEDYKNLKMKQAKGTLTDSEIAALEMMELTMQESNSVQFAQALISLACDLAIYGQQQQNYQATIVDLLTGIQALTWASLKFSDKHPLGPYENYDIPMLHELEAQMGEDIYNTWKASCTQEPEPGLVIMGLLHAAAKIASETDVKIPEEPVLTTLFHSCMPDYDMPDEDENGSNVPFNVCQPATYNPSAEDSEMRDLLKE